MLLPPPPRVENPPPGSGRRGARRPSGHGGGTWLLAPLQPRCWVPVALSGHLWVPFEPHGVEGRKRSAAFIRAGWRKGGGRVTRQDGASPRCCKAERCRAGGRFPPPAPCPLGSPTPLGQPSHPLWDTTPQKHRGWGSWRVSPNPLSPGARGRRLSSASSAGRRGGSSFFPPPLEQRALSSRGAQHTCPPWHGPAPCRRRCPRGWASRRHSRASPATPAPRLALPSRCGSPPRLHALPAPPSPRFSPQKCPRLLRAGAPSLLPSPSPSPPSSSSLPGCPPCAAARPSPLEGCWEGGARSPPGQWIAKSSSSLRRRTFPGQPRRFSASFRSRSQTPSVCGFRRDASPPPAAGAVPLAACVPPTSPVPGGGWRVPPQMDRACAVPGSSPGASGMLPWGQKGGAPRSLGTPCGGFGVLGGSGAGVTVQGWGRGGEVAPGSPCPVPAPCPQRGLGQQQGTGTLLRSVCTGRDGNAGGRAALTSCPRHGPGVPVGVAPSHPGAG